MGGYSTWTPEEKERWMEGELRCKWGAGQVSIRLPVPDAMSWTALVYGYLPFAIPIWWAVWVIISSITNGSPRFFPLYGLCIAIGFAIVNETITKQICKRTMSADVTSRPPEAVCKHPGMPSGHVMNAYTLMIWTLAEIIYDFSLHLDYFVVLLVVMGPVPWARVYNRDHTVPQVVVSGCIACFMGVLAFCLRKTYFGEHEEPWG